MRRRQAVWLMRQQRSFLFLETSFIIWNRVSIKWVKWLFHFFVIHCKFQVSRLLFISFLVFSFVSTFLLLLLLLNSSTFLTFYKNNHNNCFLTPTSSANTISNPRQKTALIDCHSNFKAVHEENKLGGSWCKLCCWCKADLVSK